jgi:hypothetical protein
LALSPSSFTNSRHIVPSDPGGDVDESLHTLGGNLLVRRRLHTDFSGQCFVILQCQQYDKPGQAVGIPVQARSGGYDNYVRLHGRPSILIPGDVPWRKT